MSNMKFSNVDRIELRKTINEKIEKLKCEIDHRGKTQKLVIEEPYLSYLLFDDHIDEKGMHYKTIGYKYDNLYYLDLSNANFEGVSFNYEPKEGEPEKINLKAINAKIDLMKSYEIRRLGHLVLKNINFRCTNLSDNNCTDEHGVSVFEKAEVENCNFFGTQLEIYTANVSFKNSILYGVGLSCDEMYPDDALETFKDCDLRETGLRIAVDERVDKESIKKIMKDPNFAGCVIRGKKILSVEQRSAKTAKLHYDHDAWKNAMIDDVAHSIERQVCGLNGDPDLQSESPCLSEMSALFMSEIEDEPENKSKALTNKMTKKEYDPLDPELPFEI